MPKHDFLDFNSWLKIKSLKKLFVGLYCSFFIVLSVLDAAFHVRFHGFVQLCGHIVYSFKMHLDYI